METKDIRTLNPVETDKSRLAGKAILVHDPETGEPFVFDATLVGGGITPEQEALINQIPDKADKTYVDDRHVVLEVELGEETEEGQTPILNAEAIFKKIHSAPEGASFYIKDGDVTVEAALKMPIIPPGYILGYDIGDEVRQYVFFHDVEQDIYNGFMQTFELAIKSEIGDLGDLQTTAKDKLVNAINEAYNHGSAEGAVRFDESQTLTEAQKGVARGNIGAISTSEMAAAILAESQRAQTAEGGLSNNILAEQTRAEGAESALSRRIDTIVQGRNVRDIVGNYDELLAYDTSTLGDNDIVMVLLDATKSGHTTYYRWKEEEGEWEFIGGLAFTYTKTEIDDKFAALHIVLPTIPADAVEHPEEYQELLAQVDTMVRGAGSDASFKMPVLVVDGISGNVDVTFVKSNPAHLYLGIFADDMSTLYHITRTISTPRTYTLQIIEKVFVTEAQATSLANDAIADALDEDAQGAIIEAIKAHHDDTKADQVALDEVKLVAEDASRTAETASQGVSEAKSELTELQSKVGELETSKQPLLTPGSGITIKDNVISATGGGSADWELLIDNTTTEDVAQWQFSQGKDGQVFNDYKRIIIDLILQQNSQGLTDQTLLKVGFEDSSAWSGTNRFNCGNVGFGTSPTRYTTAVFEKTLAGIIGYLLTSTNQASGASAGYMIGQGTTTFVTGALSSNQVNPSTAGNNLVPAEFGGITVGSYKAGIIGVDSRIRIYGQK